MVVSGATPRRGGRTQLKNRTSYPFNHTWNWQPLEVWRLPHGRTDPEIGTQLLVSACTVEWHLRNVFGKLGTASCQELRAAPAQIGQDSQPS
jgi:hypothetical protein